MFFLRYMLRYIFGDKHNEWTIKDSLFAFVIDSHRERCRKVYEPYLHPTANEQAGALTIPKLPGYLMLVHDR
jgi:hypothetical protein